MRLKSDMRKNVGIRIWPEDGKPFVINNAVFKLTDSTGVAVGEDQTLTPTAISKRDGLRLVPGYQLVVNIGPLPTGEYTGRFLYTVGNEDFDYVVEIWVTDA